MTATKGSCQNATEKTTITIAGQGHLSANLISGGDEEPVDNDCIF